MNRSLIIDQNLKGNGLIEILNLIDLKHAISYRDELVSAHLRELKVSTLIDIGCDFGNLVSIANNYGISSMGIEANMDAVNLAKDSGLNVVQGTFQEVVSEDFNKEWGGDGILAVSLLNVLGGDWENHELKNKLIKFCIFNSDYFVTSVFKKDLKLLVNEHNLEIVTFISSNRKPISRPIATYLQYGHPLFSRKNIFELRIWQKLTLGKFLFQKRIEPFHRHVVILRKKSI